MVKRKIEKVMGNQFPFYEFLKTFYKDNKSKVRRYYKDLTKKFLDYNDKEKNSEAFLREPQFEALEMYVFIKEFLDNKQMYEIFDEWRNKEGKFADTNYFKGSIKKGQLTFFDETAKEHDIYFKELNKFSADYSNYIFSLAMGLGKTLLMATCIFYEFLLANKFPKDERFCHNALIFAPDLTVLQSLSEILTFDKTKVVPKEYAAVLDANIKIHYLTEGNTLNTIDKSDFNIIISNTQKIIVKRKTSEKTPGSKLFTQTKIIANTSLDDAISLIYGEAVNPDNLDLNQRFMKLSRLPHLGIYVDEAHHMFGADLEKALRSKDKTDHSNTSLRNTINLLSEYLRNEKNKDTGTTHLKYQSGIVGCYNFTGTPYVENSILPEVVYSYGLKEAIQNEYLKEVDVIGYENVKNEDFLRGVITEFWENYGGKTYDGLNPKLAIFGSKIDEIINEVKPAVEDILSELGIPITTILVNVGDTKDGKRYTSEADIGLFNSLDVKESEGNKKQFLLLVNKGREGWNCKSLFSVVLYRKLEKKSRVFVLQATMRCLRQITEEQQKARVFLSKENYEILNDELEKNFRLQISDLTKSESKREKYQVKVIPPPRYIKVKVIRHEYTCDPKKAPDKVDFKLSERDFSKYKATRYLKELGANYTVKEENIDYVRKTTHLNRYQLVFEIALYLNIKPTVISKILDTATDRIDKILELVNTYNDILYDILIPEIFNSLYEVKSNIITEEKTLLLLKEPKNAGYYEFSANPDLVIKNSDSEVQKYVSKSFHADTYCFDSKPEMECFRQYLRSSKVNKVYFTGMFTSNQGDFSIQYIDPESMRLRRYYPDFMAEMQDGTYQIIEVKGDNMIDDSVVKAKSYAALEIASIDSKMEYKIYPGNLIMKTNVLEENTQRNL
ncbi:MAG: DEAD/DEAH box helicase family protein [Acholeplasmataceae bacterium]|nr:DEAD/DEAH box helicase family protein [Acholeplasmataceae bacterium]